MSCDASVYKSFNSVSSLRCRQVLEDTDPFPVAAAFSVLISYEENAAILTIRFLSHFNLFGWLISAIFPGLIIFPGLLRCFSELHAFCLRQWFLCTSSQVSGFLSLGNTGIIAAFISKYIRPAFHIGPTSTCQADQSCAKLRTLLPTHTHDFIIICPVLGQIMEQTTMSHNDDLFLRSSFQPLPRLPCSFLQRIGDRCPSARLTVPTFRHPAQVYRFIFHLVLQHSDIGAGVTRNISGLLDLGKCNHGHASFYLWFETEKGGVNGTAER